MRNASVGCPRPHRRLAPAVEETQRRERTKETRRARNPRTTGPIVPDFPRRPAGNRAGKIHSLGVFSRFPFVREIAASS